MSELCNRFLLDVRPNTTIVRVSHADSKTRRAGGRLASVVRGSFIGTQEAWGYSKFERGPGTVSSYIQRFGIYIFLISFACAYYLSNASILLGHTDLGWHLAAGDLIRAKGNIPFQDPWSFTAGDRQWYNLSWLWDVLASAIVQYTGFGGLTLFVVACGALIVGCLTSICLGSGASALAVCISVFSACLLYPSFATVPNIYLAASPNTSTMLFCVIFYGECLKRTRWFLLPLIMVLWVNLHGGFLLGFLIVGTFCSAALLRRDWLGVKIYSMAGVWLLPCDIYQSAWLAYLRRRNSDAGPLCASVHHRVAALFAEYICAGEPSWNHIYFDICRD